ncbi:MAG TPA: YdbL family protein [Nevskia sp.]|nr:YdbL family protein [Nevskia sp.]
MKRPYAASVLGLLLLASSCVTINVYFPAAAAQKAADRIIDDVIGAGAIKKDAAPPPPPPAPQSLLELPRRTLLALLDCVIPTAQAQQADIDISSPEIQRLKSSMQSRSAALRAYLDSGAVGFSADGLVAQRDANLVPLADRNAVRNLVAAENADRTALYHQIASANGHAEWETQIRQTFAARWIAKAQTGWWYQDSGGNWKQR